MLNCSDRSFLKKKAGLISTGGGWFSGGEMMFLCSVVHVFSPNITVTL
jgi:hypothetical protein